MCREAGKQASPRATSADRERHLDRSRKQTPCPGRTVSTRCDLQSSILPPIPREQSPFVSKASRETTREGARTDGCSGQRQAWSQRRRRDDRDQHAHVLQETGCGPQRLHVPNLRTSCTPEKHKFTHTSSTAWTREMLLRGMEKHSLPPTVRTLTVMKTSSRHGGLHTRAKRPTIYAGQGEAVPMPWRMK